MPAIDWIRNPSLAPSGYKDSKIFVDAVSAIFEQDREYVDNSHIIRDLLTYLLLKRNPATDTIITLDHMRPGSEGVVPEDIAILKSSTRTSLERYLNHTNSQPFSTVMLIQRMILNPSQNWANPEELSILILAMWLFTRKISTDDISTQRSCLRLYFDSLAKPKTNVEREFINSDIWYSSWLLNEIERIFCTFDDMSLILREISYIGIFVSLLRAVRMSTDDHPLVVILRDEIVWLQSKTTLN